MRSMNGNPDSQWRGSPLANCPEVDGSWPEDNKALALSGATALRHKAEAVILSTLITLVVCCSLLFGYDSLFPDNRLTPGVVATTDTAKLCTPHYTETVRGTTTAQKKEVFRRYGLDWNDRAHYEVDHFISLELGGADVIENLWPESYDGEWGARKKDVVETWLHRQVCQGKMTIQEAQSAIQDNWIVVYKKIKGGKKK